MAGPGGGAQRGGGGGGVRGEDLQVGLDGGEDVALQEGQDHEQEDWLPQLLQAHLEDPVVEEGANEGVNEEKKRQSRKKII